MPARNPADLVLRSRYRQTVLFPDLTERLALRLSSILTYTAKAHFGVWHRKMGGPDFTEPDGRVHAAGGGGARGDRCARRRRGSPSWCAARPISPRPSTSAARSASSLARAGTRCTTWPGAGGAGEAQQRLHPLRSRPGAPARHRAAARAAAWATAPSRVTDAARRRRARARGSSARLRRAIASASGTTGRPTPTAT